MAFIGAGPNVTNLDAGNVATGTLAVGRGGTGATSLAANNVLLGNGTSALQTVAPGTSGNVLTSNGTTWTSAAPAAPAAPTTSQVLTATAGATYGAVGTYMFGNSSTASGVAAGSTRAGSALRSTSAAYRQSGEGGYGNWSLGASSALSGTWRAMSTYTYSTTSNAWTTFGATLWLRIS